MKKRFCVVLALLMCVMMFASSASALVIDGSNSGAVRRGIYYNGDLSIAIPASGWEEVSAVSYKDYDEIYFQGTADVNGFIPGIMMRVYDSPWDMDAEFSGLDISGSNIRVVNQNFTVDGKRVHYDCYFSNGNGRMELDYMASFNVGDYGILLYYYSFSATRSIPDDLPMLDDMIDSVTIAGVED